MPAFSFDNDNENIVSLTQGQVQDGFWVHEAAVEIRTKKLPGYFVPQGTQVPHEATKFYVVISRPQAWVTHFEKQWNRLVKDEFITLWLFGNWDPVVEVPRTTPEAMDVDKQTGLVGDDDELSGFEWPKKFQAKIMSRPGGIHDLTGHVNTKEYPHDLVLAVDCKFMDLLKFFGERGAAESQLQVRIPNLDKYGHLLTSLQQDEKH